jgi:hypothetical protein
MRRLLILAAGATIVHGLSVILARRGFLAERDIVALPLSPLWAGLFWSFTLAILTWDALPSRRHAVVFSLAMGLWLALVTFGLQRAAI